jgi:hypothetical protein
MPQPPPRGRSRAASEDRRSSSTDVREASSSISSGPITYGGMK